MSVSLDTAATSTRRGSPARPRSVAYAMVVAFTGAILILTAHGFLLLDDYELQSRAFLAPSLEWSFLVQPWGGHFMPAGFALAQVLAKSTPFTFIPMVALITAGLGTFAFVLARLLLYVLGDRWRALVPLTLILTSGALWDSATWWIAALNSVPLLIAIPLATHLHLRWLKEADFRSGLAAWVTTVIACAFFEKAVGLALFIALLSLALRGRWSPARRPGGNRVLVVLYAFAVAAFAYGYVSSTTGTVARAPEVAVLMDFIALGARTFPPLLFGGPWAWAQPAVAATPLWLSVAAANAVLLIALAQSLKSRRAALLWAGILVYLIAIVAVIAVGRSGWGVQVIAQPRYFVDAVVYTVIAASVAAAYLMPAGSRSPATPPPTSPPPVSPPPTSPPSAWSLAGAVLIIQLAVVSLMLTVPYLSTHLLANASRTYVIGSINSLSTSDAQVNNGLVPGDVLWPLIAPANQIRPFFAPLFEGERFPDSRGSLDVLNAFGALRPGVVVDDQARPSDTTCPVILASRETTVDIPQDLPDYWHTIAFSYVAEGPTTISVSIGDGDPVPVDMLPGLHAAFVFAGGAGDRVTFERVPDGTGVCISDLSVGFTRERLP